MTQEAIELRTTGDTYPGVAVIQDTNKALATVATDFAGAADPASLAGAWMTWADTGTMRLKRRNGANSAWVDLGPLLEEMAAKTDLTAAADLAWLGTPIGGYITPFEPPPTDDPRFRYILCTAGETGPGGYNEGVLTNESVTGSGALIIANADISLAGSPMLGTNIPLINTDGRFIGAGEVEALEADAFQGHKVQIVGSEGTGALKLPAFLDNRLLGVSPNATAGLVSDGTNGIPRTSDRTQPKTLRKIHYQRIF